MCKKILIIRNPVSGTIYNRFKFNKFIKQLESKYKINIKNTTNTIGADDIIRNEQKDYDLVSVCGGDGTLNQVVTEFSKNETKKTPIIYIPFGTTNDFGKSLKVQKNKKDEYIKKECDTGLINKKQYFNYIVATGLFTRSSYETSRKAKRIFGRLAYIINGIKDLFNIKEYEATVYINDKIINDKFIYMSISNSYFIGGFRIFKENEIKLNDGNFEIFLVKKPKNIFKLVRLGIKILLKNHDDDNIVFLQSQNVKIKTKKEINWTFDGENSGKYNEINISNINKNIEFITFVWSRA